MKKIIFIVPTGRYSLGTQICAPTRLLLITSYLKKYYPDVECEILDLQLWGIPLNERGEKKIVDRLIRDLQTKVNDETIIGFSVMANFEIIHMLPMLQRIKENFSNPIILGGYAATTCYQLLLENYHSLIDAICLGAGEIPVLEMLKHLKNGKIDYEKVPNLVYWEEGVIRNTECIPPLNYDDLPVVDFSLLKGSLEKYNAISFSTARGCAWNCEFCQEKKLYPHFSTRSRKKVEKDLENLCAHTNKKLLNLSDPLFGLDYTSSKEIVETLNSYGFNYQFGSRCDVFHEQLYKDMGENCKLIFFGFESASPARLLQMLKTKNPTKYISQMKEQLRRCFEHDVFAIIAIIINYPKNTVGDLFEVLNFNKDVKEILKNYDTNNGYLFRTYPFYIYYGDYYFSKLEELGREGLTYDYVYPERYHGIAIPREIELEVLNSSKELDVSTLHTYWDLIHNSSRISTDKCKDILRSFFGPNLVTLKKSGEVNSDFFIDDGDIVYLSNIIENIDKLDKKYPYLNLKDPRFAFQNPFENRKERMSI